MTSDTARRLAEEKYPRVWADGRSMDRADALREGFLAGWDAAIEHTAQGAEGGSDGRI